MKAGYVDHKADPGWLKDTVRAGRIQARFGFAGDISATNQIPCVAARGEIYNVKMYDAGSGYTSDTTVTFDLPRTRLLRNDEFEFWPVSASTVPAPWTLSGAGAGVARNTTAPLVGSSCLTLTRGGADSAVSQSMILPRGMTYWKGRSVQYGAWVNAGTANSAYVSITDGINTVRSAAHTGDATWQLLTVDMTIDLQATVLTVSNEVRNSNVAVDFDNCAFLDLTDGHAQAKGRVVLSTGTIVKVIVDDPGCGYTVDMDANRWNPWPQVTFRGTGGSGAKGIAYVPQGLADSPFHGTLHQGTHYVMQDGTLRASGLGTGGRLGVGVGVLAQWYPSTVCWDIDTTDYDDPENPLVPIMTFASYSCSWCLTSDGNLWHTGYNAYYMGGRAGDTTVKTVFTRIPPSSIGNYPIVKFKAVMTTADYQYQFLLNANQDLYRWGYNANYQLGNGTTTVQQTPQLLSLSGLNKAVDFTFVGGNQLASTMYLDGNRKVWFTGNNQYGQGGQGHVTTLQTFTAFNTASATPITDVIRLRGGGGGTSTGYHTTYLLQCVGGRCWCAGYGLLGELADGTILSTASGWPNAAMVSAGVDFTGIVDVWTSNAPGGSSNYVFVRKYDETIHSWGANENGQQGFGDVTRRWFVTQNLASIIGTEYVVDIRCGNGASTGSTVGWTTGGRVFVAGINSSGQLGVNDVTQRTAWNVVKWKVPSKIINIMWQNRCVSSTQTMQILTRDGNVYMCGDNTGYILGDGTVTAHSWLQRVRF